MSYLVLIRHGESEWNAKGLWTGLTDIGLSEKGRQEARAAARAIKNIKFNIAYTSVLKRSKETLHEIETELEMVDVPTVEDAALNERNYGEYTGKNKWEIQKEVGEEEFLRIRRGWDVPIPGGEALKDVYNRVIPFYQNHILPNLKLGKNVLVTAHGNSLRALVKYLDNISDDDISKLEIALGEVYVYQVDKEGKITGKEMKSTA